ncbi:MAG: hypothetical protein MUO42_04120 [Anaerolineaceae bacterium]|nr:hypothetical protein [Anaerolineaceae bacterium]
MKKEVISKFKEKPRTKIAWWAMGLGLGTILVWPMLGFFAAIIRPIIDKASSENVGATVGFGAGFVLLILSVSALVAGVRAFRKGERSWVLWVGFVPAILVGAFWVFMIIGEFIFPH